MVLAVCFSSAVVPEVLQVVRVVRLSFWVVCQMLRARAFRMVDPSTLQELHQELG